MRNRAAGGGGSPGDSSDPDDFDDLDDADSQRGEYGSQFRRRQRGPDRRGGLRSRGSVLLDKEQAQVEKLLFHEDADAVLIYFADVPYPKCANQIPPPGQAGALTTTKDSKHTLTFNNDMEAVMAEKTFKSFKAFSLSEMMEFQQMVEYVAAYQPPERAEVTASVVEGVRVIAKNAIQAHADMRDSGTLGANGENYRSNNYIQVMYMVMFREVFEGAMSDMWFATFAAKFAYKHRGSSGLSPWRGSGVQQRGSQASARDRCLRCGKAGHKASDARHANDVAEGGTAGAQDELRAALSTIENDDELARADKKRWSTRIRAFWAALRRLAAARLS